MKSQPGPLSLPNKVRSRAKEIKNGDNDYHKKHSSGEEARAGSDRDRAGAHEQQHTDEHSLFLWTFDPTYSGSDLPGDGPGQLSVPYELRCHVSHTRRPPDQIFQFLVTPAR